ncbi:PAS domain S-box protein, partial [Lutibacter sp.]
MKKRLNLVENTLKYITKKNHEEKGSEFLKQVAKYLSDIFKVNYVLINEYSNQEPNIVKTIAFYGNGSLLPNRTYKLAHTPCENVIDNKICIYPKNIQTLFPKDYLLAQMNAESYIGIPLWSSTGVPIGLIILLDDKELKDTKTIEIVLQIVAIKVAQVVEKQLYENKLKRQIKDLELSNKKIKESENNLKDAQRIAKLGYWKLDIPTNKLIWSDEIYRIFGLKPQEFNPTYNDFLEKVHPEDRNKVNEAYLSSLKNKTPYKIEHRIVLATGETKYLIEKCNTNYNDKGEPVSSIGTVLDITKQRESEERYRGLSEASFNAIFISEKGICLDQNSTAQKMFGYSNEEAIGRLGTEWIVPEDRKIVMDKMLSGNEEPYEVKALRKDGTTFPARIQAKMMLYKGRNVRVSELSDITIHKQLEETLKKSEEKFKKLANLTFEGILIHKYGVVIDTNLSFEKMFGYNLEEIYGKDITQIIYPKKYHKIILKNRINLYTQTHEVEGIKKDGSIFPIEVEARNISVNNEEVLRVTAFRDITARKKSEREYLKLFTAVEQSANTIVITDTEGNIEYTNPKFTELTGYTNKEALGQNPRILNSGIQPKSYYKKMWETITAGKIWNGEFCNKSKSGNLFWEKVTITPIKSKEGKIINYLAVKEDTTNRKHADQELEKATNKIKESEKKFRELYEKSGDAILIIENGIFVDCNQATVNMLGYNTKEEFLNVHPSKLSPKQQPDGLDSNEKANKMMQLALDHGTHRFEWIHTKKSKKNFPVEVLLTAISNDIGNEIIHCVWRDIS